jgi:hypothetical protein
MRNLISCIAVAAAAILVGNTFAGEWTTPVPVTAINTADHEEWSPFLSNDKLTLYFSRLDSPAKIFSVTRNSLSDPFASETQVLQSSAGNIYSPWVSPDNLRMYYTQEYYSGGTRWGIKSSQRASVNDSWAEGAWVSELNISSWVSFPTMTTDELTIMFNASLSSPGNTTYDLYMATRADKNSPFSNIGKVTELSSGSNDTSPSITLSADGLTAIFASNRGNLINYSLYTATRPSLSDPFGNIEHLSLFDVPGGNATHPSLSADGKELYYVQYRGSGLSDVYVSYYIPEPGTIALIGLGAFMLRRKK